MSFIKCKACGKEYNRRSGLISKNRKLCNKCEKVFLIGGILGSIPLFLSNVPDGPWLFINPIGILLMALSGFISFLERYDIVPKEEKE